jgi:hypothetical protein
LRRFGLATSFACGLLTTLGLADCACGQSRASRADRAGAQSVPAPRVVDEARARAAGIRKLQGKHLVLYTDVKSDPAVDNLPMVFDLAVPLWAEYFGIDEAKTRNWRALRSD